MLYDDILERIGEFGPYQIMLYILLGLVGVPTAWQNMGITFFGPSMDHWCLIPELEEYPHDHQKYVGIPDGEEGYNQCDMFDLPFSNFTPEDIMNWNRTMIPEDTPTIKCGNGWVYDQSEFYSSLMSEFDLVCDDASKIPLVQTIYMLGFLTGGIVFGLISDKIGRYNALVISLVIGVVFSTVATFIPNYAAYVTMRFFVGASAAGGFTTMFVMCMEIIGPRYRLATGVMVQAWFALGFMTIPGMSYAIRDHKKLQLVCGLSPIVLWALFGLADESPRWLVSEGYDEKAIQVLKKIARINGTTLPDNLNLAENRSENLTKPESESDRKPNGTDLFRTPGLRKVTFNMWFDWFVTSMVYYGLSLGVDMLPGSIFLNSFLSAIMEIPALILTIFALQYLGRKWPNFITLVAGGICCLLCMGFTDNEELEQGATAFLLIGKFFTSATFAIVYIYSAELFPTVIRQVGIGSSSMCDKAGSLIQPQIQRLENLWPPGTFLVYGVLSIVGGVLTLLLPETLNKKLPDTVEEGEKFARDVKFTLKMTIPKRPPRHKAAHDGDLNVGFEFDEQGTKNFDASQKGYNTFDNGLPTTASDMNSDADPEDSVYNESTML